MMLEIKKCTDLRSSWNKMGFYSLFTIKFVMQEQKKETTIHLSVNQNRVGLTSIRKGSSAVQTNFNIFVHQNKSDLETINFSSCEK